MKLEKSKFGRFPEATYVFTVTEDENIKTSLIFWEYLEGEQSFIMGIQQQNRRPERLNTRLL